jgi:hypothetical protein
MTSQEPARFRIPLGWLVAAIGVVLCIVLFFQAPTNSRIAFAIACAVGGVLYLARRK